MGLSPEQKEQVVNGGPGRWQVPVSRLTKGLKRRLSEAESVYDVLFAPSRAVEKAWDQALDVVADAKKEELGLAAAGLRGDLLSLQTIDSQGEHINVYLVPVTHVVNTNALMAKFNEYGLDFLPEDSAKYLFEQLPDGHMAQGRRWLVYSGDQTLTYITRDLVQVLADAYPAHEMLGRPDWYVLGYRNEERPEVKTSWFVPFGDTFPQQLLEMRVVSVSDMLYPETDDFRDVALTNEWTRGERKHLEAFIAHVDLTEDMFENPVCAMADDEVVQYVKMISGMPHFFTQQLGSEGFVVERWLHYRIVDRPALYPIWVDGRQLEVGVFERERIVPPAVDGYTYTPATHEHIAAFYAQHLSLVKTHLNFLMCGAADLDAGRANGVLAVGTAFAGGEETARLFVAESGFDIDRIGLVLYVVGEKTEPDEEAVQEQAVEESEASWVVKAPLCKKCGASFLELTALMTAQHNFKAIECLDCLDIAHDVQKIVRAGQAKGASWAIPDGGMSSNQEKRKG